SKSRRQSRGDSVMNFENYFPRAIGCGIAFPFLLFLIGCGSDGPEIVPVKGTVLLDDKPISGATITFIPVGEGRPAIGKTDDQGQFELTTIKTGDGALIGEHEVTVTLMKTTGASAQVGEDGLQVGNVDPSAQKVEWIVPQKYSQPKTSGLRVEVPIADKELVLRLSSN
ncbi:MAG: hypothetical protein KDA84_09400, partial [Planctomycetaceae bacterium]|nr:hypothetical protein [Planctomycetaceae bacterium]